MSRHLVRQIDADTPPFPAVLEVACPFCRATPMRPCLGTAGIPLGEHWHRQRVEAAVTAALLAAP